MIWYKDFEYKIGNVDTKGYDTNIYTFDIETTSYIKINNKILPAIKYNNLTQSEKEICEFKSCMYIWQFGINDTIYYGRTWNELKRFLYRLNYYNPFKKICYVHNLSFEFNFLKSEFNITEVFARKAHKVIKCFIEEYNIILKCSYFLTNCKLEILPKIFNLEIEKKVGDLDYNLLRTPITPLTEKELKYCEYDCLVVYNYIKQIEIPQYKTISKIPLTSTGHIRKELKTKSYSNFYYRTEIQKSINTDPHVYNLLQEAFMGGYTHSNWIYTDQVLSNVTSYDFTSSYPYVMVSEKYPMTEFKKCYIKNFSDLYNKFAYILVIEFENIKSKFYNNFISASKCKNLIKGSLDNGRLIEAEHIEIVVTDIDLKLIIESYNFKSYKIKESYYSSYKYLPKMFVEFILEKYINKTKLKNVENMEVEYAKEKNKFNSLYGMTVTNMIRDEVIYDNNLQNFYERELTNQEIEEKLIEQKEKPFLNFATGVWVTAYARRNLIENIIKLDDKIVYCDTDSIKLIEGYDKTIINNYNKKVQKKIKSVSEILKIDIEKFAPKDKKGISHMLGLFEEDSFYKKFITQGAKKYCYIIEKENSKIKSHDNIIKKGNEKSEVLEITVAGVPKEGSKCLKNIEDFRDNLVFDYTITGKNLLCYCENQNPEIIIDYLGNKYQVNDNTGCCIFPTSYILGKSLDYANLLSDNSSKRAVYKEE